MCYLDRTFLMLLTPIANPVANALTTRKDVLRIVPTINNARLRLSICRACESSRCGQKESHRDNELRKRRRGDMLVPIHPGHWRRFSFVRRFLTSASTATVQDARNFVA